MIDISFRKDLKTLVLEISGHIKNDEAFSKYYQLQEALFNTKGEYFILTDITNLSNSTDIAKEVLREAMKLIDFFQPKAVIRIIKNYSNAMLFDAIFSKSQSNYSLYRVPNMEVALEIISEFDMQRSMLAKF